MGHNSPTWLTAVAGLLVASLGCGSRTTASDGDTTETSTTETSTTETSTGGQTAPEPVECTLPTCELTIDGSFAELAGVEPSHGLGCVLGVMQSTWWLQGATITEHIDGVQHHTQIIVDARGGALVMQSNASEGYTRVEHCELAPAEFFAGCTMNFDPACADFDNWFGACTSEDLACPSVRDCGLASDCDPLELGPDSDADPSCVWTTLRDAELFETMLDADYALIGWHYEGLRLHLDASSRNVGVEGYAVDDVSTWNFIGRCELRSAAFFQACLDDPDGDPSCEQPRSWITDCVEQPVPCL